MLVTQSNVQMLKPGFTSLAFEFDVFQRCIWIRKEAYDTYYYHAGCVAHVGGVDYPFPAWGIRPSSIHRILDVVKVTVLGIICHPCSQCRITMPEVAIGTVGIEDASLRIE